MNLNLQRCLIEDPICVWVQPKHTKTTQTHSLMFTLESSHVFQCLPVFQPGPTGGVEPSFPANSTRAPAPIPKKALPHSVVLESRGKRRQTVTGYIKR